ncbi:MAG: DUF427 domain-containing protein [Daejeonella sp.]
MKALWNNQIIAESDNTIQHQDKIFFPPHSIKKEFLRESLTHDVTHEFGVASFYTIKIWDQENLDAAYFFSEPVPEASHIKNYVAFNDQIEITQD